MSQVRSPSRRSPRNSLQPVPSFCTTCSAVGPSGHETDPARAWREGCEAFADEVGGDHVGSSFARVRGTAGGPTLAIVGHIDEIGLHISHIDDDGYLRFGQVGGWDPVVLIGQRVTLITRDGAGAGRDRAQADPPAQGRGPQAGPRDQGPAHRHRRQGRRGGARTMVRIGDVAVIDADPVELPHGRVVSRALDNRVGCYVAAEAARLVAEHGGAPGDVVALRRRPGGDDVRGLAHERVRARAGSRDRRRSDVRDRSARESSSARSPSTRSTRAR